MLTSLAPGLPSWERGPSDLSLLLIHSPLGKTGVKLLPPPPLPLPLKGHNQSGVSSVWVLTPQ